jgi:hypothetical protein
MSKFSIDDTVGEPKQDAPRAVTKPHDASDGSGSVQASGKPGSPNENARQVAPSGTKGRAKKVERSEPKQGHGGFSVAEDDWLKTIPPLGHYPAAISGSVILKSGIAWLKLEYVIQHNVGQRHTLSELLVLDADPQDPKYSQSVRGKGRLKAIMEVNGRPLTFSDINEVPKALLGCRAIIAVVHKDTDGLPVPTVRGIVGPAESEEEP